MDAGVMDARRTRANSLEFRVLLRKYAPAKTKYTTSSRDRPSRIRRLFHRPSGGQAKAKKVSDFRAKGDRYLELKGIRTCAPSQFIRKHVSRFVTQAPVSILILPAEIRKVDRRMTMYDYVT